ncbi:MAG: hypothetical protein ITG04_12330 [Proteiniphilum sp.]|nr:hypothetical protein [Proteiniphilum sp.]
MNELYLVKIQPQTSITLPEAEYLLEKNAITHPIQQLNWEQFHYSPKVAFRIAHTGDRIWLKYYVCEKYIRAMETRINGRVHKDSCVEFFISFDKENYYNFEFNCIGIAHVAYGSGRSKRKFVNTQLIEKIEIQSSLGNKPFDTRSGDFTWEMMIRIPIECFAFSDVKNLSNLSGSANFYKCGDATTEPHYLSWNSIETDNPDFHRPDFFGKVFFPDLSPSNLVRS